MSAQARVVAISNQKGGVGKSTTAEALAQGLSIRGRKVLLVDLDPQGSVSLSSGVDRSKPTSYDLLVGKTSASGVIQRNAHKADIVPASGELARLDVEIASAGREYLLKEAIASVLSRYDYIVVDTPPGLGTITINALTAADNLVIPAQADVYSLQGVGQLRDTIEAVQAITNPGLSLRGVLLTRHNTRSVLSRDMAYMTCTSICRQNEHHL